MSLSDAQLPFSLHEIFFDITLPTVFLQFIKMINCRHHHATHLPWVIQTDAIGTFRNMPKAPSVRYYKNYTI